VSIRDRAKAKGKTRPSRIDQKRLRRSMFLIWLRKTHGWVGLWGAALGLLFGVTGFLLNHRSVMKIPAAQTQESIIQLQLPVPFPTNAKNMGLWLQQELTIDRAPSKTREEDARTVAWGDKALKQPAHWSVSFNSPRRTIQADYWVGNSFITIKQNDNNIFGALSNLHKGSGLGAGWILLVDTLAGSIVLLSLTGVLLWTQLYRRRLIGSGIAVTSVGLMSYFALQAM
jgi:uncharacterized protein